MFKSVLVFLLIFTFQTYSHAIEKLSCISSTYSYHPQKKGVRNELKLEETLENIKELSGVKPLKDESCLMGRCSLENRIITRKYLIDKLRSYGLTEAQMSLESIEELAEVIIQRDGDQIVLTDKIDALSQVDRLDQLEANQLKKILKKRLVNLVVTIKGSKFPNEVVELSAHYDTVRTSPGADDNGSGVAALLEVARIFQQGQPERTIRLVFADLEEIGFIGTYLHVEKIKKETDLQLVGSLVIDTIGYYPTADSTKPHFVIEVGTSDMHQSEVSYDATVNFANIVVDQMRTNERVADGNIELKKALPFLADHGPYWSSGYPALLIAAAFDKPYINPGYHKATDTFDKINESFFGSIVSQIMEVVARLSGVQIDAETQNAGNSNVLNHVEEKMRVELKIED